MKKHPYPAKYGFCALLCLLCTFALISALCMFAMAAQSTSPHALTEGSITLSDPAMRYAISGMSEDESVVTPYGLTIHNQNGAVCAFYVTLCASGPDTAYFPLLSVKGGGANRIAVYLYIDGDVTVDELCLSNYACAELILSTSAGGSLRINRITSKKDAKKTLLGTDSGKLATTVSLPEEYSEIGPSKSITVPLVLTLQPASIPTYTVVYIVPEKPAYDRLVEGCASGTLIAPPVIEDDDGTVTAWYTDPGKSDLWQAETDILKGDLTLYAEWHTHLYDRTLCDDEDHFLSCACGKEKAGSRQAHSFVEKTESADTLAAAADCTHPALYYYSCACGAVSDTTFESENHLKTPHTEETEGNKIVCSVCGAILREIPPSDEQDEKEPPADHLLPQELIDEQPTATGYLPLFLLIGGLIFILVLVIACSRLFFGKK